MLKESVPELAKLANENLGGNAPRGTRKTVRGPRSEAERAVTSDKWRVTRNTAGETGDGHTAFPGFSLDYRPMPENGYSRHYTQP